jgi:single-strand DNA-binding protein
MSGSVNRVTLVGNLGKDPEARSMNNGGEVVSFSLAVSETWNDKQSGERKEKTEWVPIVIFNEGLGNVAKQYLRKGSQCYLEGSLQTRKWTDQNGNDKYTTEVVLQKFRGELVLLGKRSDEGVPRERSNEGRQQTGSAASAFDSDLDDDLSDSVPF